MAQLTVGHWAEPMVGDWVEPKEPMMAVKMAAMTVGHSVQKTELSWAGHWAEARDASKVANLAASMDASMAESLVRLKAASRVAWTDWVMAVEMVQQKVAQKAVKMAAVKVVHSDELQAACLAEHWAERLVGQSVELLVEPKVVQTAANSVASMEMH